MDRKLTNKKAYPKSIVFDGLEGNYSETHSIRDNMSSCSRKRSMNEDKYSVIHAPQEKDEVIPENQDEGIEDKKEEEVSQKEDDVLKEV